MPQFIVALRDKFVMWSTIVDAPVSEPMTLEQLTRYMRKEGGEEAIRALPERLARVDAKGTSAINDADANDTMWMNRAGAGESRLTRAQLEAWLFGEVDKRPEGSRWSDYENEDDDPWSPEVFAGITVHDDGKRGG